MQSILLDESVPVRLTDMLAGETRRVKHASELGFTGASDRELMAVASREGIDVFVTCDQNLVRQQNVSRLPFGIVVVCTNNWSTIRGNRAVIALHVEQVRPGTFVAVLKGAHLTRHGRSPKLMGPSS